MHFISSCGYNLIFLQNLTNNIGNLSLLLLKFYRSETEMVIFWTLGYFTGKNRAILPTAYTQVILILFSTCISCANNDRLKA